MPGNYVLCVLCSAIFQVWCQVFRECGLFLACLVAECLGALVSRRLVLPTCSEEKNIKKKRLGLRSAGHNTPDLAFVGAPGVFDDAEECGGAKKVTWRARKQGLILSQLANWPPRLVVIGHFSPALSQSSWLASVDWPEKVHRTFVYYAQIAVRKRQGPGKGDRPFTHMTKHDRLDNQHGRKSAPPHFSWA